MAPPEADFNPPPPPPSPLLQGVALSSWAKAVDAVTQASSRYGTALSHARLAQLQPGSVHLAFAPQANFHKNSVLSSGRNLIEKVLSEFFKTPTQLVEANGAQAYALAKPSLAEQQANLRDAQTRKLEAKVHANAHIQSALSVLEGHIESIRLLEASRPPPSPSFEEKDEGNDND